MNKKALILIDVNNLWSSIGKVEALCDEGYDLYAEGETALFFNKNMIPTSTIQDKSMQFDCVLH